MTMWFPMTGVVAGVMTMWFPIVWWAVRSTRGSSWRLGIRTMRFETLGIHDIHWYSGGTTLDRMHFKANHARRKQTKPGHVWIASEFSRQQAIPSVLGANQLQKIVHALAEHASNVSISNKNRQAPSKTRLLCNQSTDVGPMMLLCKNHRCDCWQGTSFCSELGGCGPFSSHRND